MLQMLSS